MAHEYRALDMANAEQFARIVCEIQPDIIVPEGRSDRHQRIGCRGRRGAQVVPSAEIASICMDRERLRVLAHEGGIADHAVPLRQARWKRLRALGQKRLATRASVKPIMSSSGHGQSVVRSADAIDAAWVEGTGKVAAHDG